MAGEENVGKVWFEVDADTDDVEESLDDLARDRKIDIDVEVDKSSEKKARKSIDDLTSDRKVDVEFKVDRASERRVEIIIDELNRPRITVFEPQVKVRAKHQTKDALDDIAQERTVDYNPKPSGRWSLWTGKRLDFLSRDRLVRFRPVIDNKAYQAVEAALYRLSGARFTRDIGRSVTEAFKNIDKVAPVLGIATTAVLGLGGAAVGATGSLLGLVNSLSQIAPLALAMPGMYMSAGAAMAVLSLSMKDAGKRLGDLGPAFKNLQKSFSGKFWEQAEQPIRNLANHLLPLLDAQLGLVATSWGKWMTTLAGALTSADHLIRTVLGDTAKSIDRGREGVNSWTHAFLLLGTIGSKYMIQLVDAANRVGASFDKWVTTNEKNGNLFKWVDNAVVMGKYLASTLWSTVMVLGTLSRAANEAGFGGLMPMAEAMNAAAKALNSPEGFQRAVDFFVVGKQSLDALLPGLKDLGSGFMALGPTLSVLAPLAASALGEIGTILGNVFRDEAFSKGLSALVLGFSQAVTTLKGASGPLASVLGTLMTTAGKVLPVIATTFTGVLTAAAPVISSLGGAIAALAPVIGEKLLKAVQVVSPYLVRFFDWTAKFVTENPDLTAAILSTAVAFGLLFKGALSLASGLKTLKELGSAFGFLTGKGGLFGKVAADGSKIPGLFSRIGGAFKAIPGVFGKIAGVAGKVPALFSRLGGVLTKLPGLLRLAAVGFRALGAAMMANPIGLIIGAIVAIGIALVVLYKKNEKFRNFVNKAWLGIWDTMKAVGSWFKDTLWPWMQGVWDGISGKAVESWNLIKSAWGAATGVFASVKDAVVGSLQSAWNWVSGTFASLWAGIVNIFGPPLNTVRKIVEVFAKAWWLTFKWVWTNIIGGVIGAWQKIIGAFQSAWNWVSGTFLAIWGTLAGAIVGVLRNAWANVKTVWGLITAAFQTAWSWVSGVFLTAWRTLTASLSSVLNAALGLIRTAWNGIRAAFQSVWNWVSGVFAAGWSRVRDYLSGPVNTAKGLVNSAISGVRAIFQGLWNWAGGTFSKLWSGFTNVIMGPVNKAKAALDKAIGAIKSAWNTLPDAIGKSWDKLSSVLKRPIEVAAKYVVNPMINSFNNLAHKVGMDKNKLAEWKPFYSGGYTGTRPTRAVAGVVHGKEFVMDAATTAKAGGERAMEFLRSAIRSGWRPPGFRNGGMVPDREGRSSRSTVTHVIPEYRGGGFVKTFNPVPGGVTNRHSSAQYPWASFAGDFAQPMGVAIAAWKDAIVAAVNHWGYSYGNHVRLNHPDGTSSLYAHMSRTAVSPGQQVAGGSTIGYVGSTGKSSGPHLHFETMGSPFTGGAGGSGVVASLFGKFKDAVGWLKDAFTGPMRKLSMVGGTWFGDNVVKALPMKIKDGLTNWGHELFDIGKHAGRKLKNIGKALLGKGGYAGGTNNASRGWHMVGERGPELMHFRGGEKVVNATRTRQIVNESGRRGDSYGDVHLNVSMDDLAQLRTMEDFMRMVGQSRARARMSVNSGTVSD